MNPSDFRLASFLLTLAPFATDAISKAKNKILVGPTISRVFQVRPPPDVKSD